MIKKIKLSKRTIFLFKILISTLLIIYLFVIRKIDVSQVFLFLKGVSFFWLIIGFILLGLGRLITAARWQILLSAQKIHVPLKLLITSLFVANFFNLFLPSTIGGDAMRAYDISRYSKRPGTTIMMIIIERIMGIFALVVIAVFSLFFTYFLKKDFWYEYQISNLVLPVIALFAITLIGMFSISHPLFVKGSSYLLSKVGLEKLQEKIKKAGEIFCLLKQNRWCLGMGFLLSFVLQVNVIVYTYVIALSLNLGIPFIYFCIIVPLVFIILIIPVSINGIGIRENAYVFFLRGFILSAEAVALSWLLFFTTLVLGAIGGLVYVIRHEPVPKNYG